MFSRLANDIVSAYVIERLGIKELSDSECSMVNELDENSAHVTKKRKLQDDVELLQLECDIEELKRKKQLQTECGIEQLKRKKQLQLECDIEELERKKQDIVNDAIAARECAQAARDCAVFDRMDLIFKRYTSLKLPGAERNRVIAVINRYVTNNTTYLMEDV